MLKSTYNSQLPTNHARQISAVLQRLSYRFHQPTELADVEQALSSAWSAEIWEDSEEAEELCFMHAGQQLGIRLAPARLSLRSAVQLADEGYPVVTHVSNGTQSDWWIIEEARGKRVSAVRIDEALTVQQVGRRELAAIWKEPRNTWCAQPVLQCQTLSAPSAQHEHAHTTHGQRKHGGGHGHATGHGAHAHPKPLTRLIALLKLDTRDIYTLGLFGLVAGLTSLATPLAVESLVNTVAWGSYIQPLFVLTVLLFGFLAFGGVLRALQSVVVEIMQQRIFVRIVGDLAHRFALARRDALEGEDPAELTNRYFDIMTIQKSTAVILLDGLTIITQTIIGLILLAFYHPFLLGFDIILLSAMVGVTLVLGRGGVRTSIQESIIKYRMGHWLQDLISFPTAFHLHGGQGYATDRANRLTVEYIMARRRHFRVLIRQVAFSLALQALASTALLGVGGWLVIRGELTLGQLVAAELVVTAIVGAFAKIGKSLESYYDLMAAMDKVGHLLDVPTGPEPHYMRIGMGAAGVRWQNLPLSPGKHGGDVRNGTIPAGSRTAITGTSASGKSWLMEVLAGLRYPESGFAEIGGLDARDAATISDGSLVALACYPQLFHGTLQENIRLGRGWISPTDIRETLELVGLWEDAMRLPNGIDTLLQTGGYPLSIGLQVRLMIARAIIVKPRVLLIDGVLDLLAPDERYELWERISDKKHAWTLLIATHDERLISLCDSSLILGRRNAPAHH
jgi:putative ABC transport system ATP-binding protein